MRMSDTAIVAKSIELMLQQCLSTCETLGAEIDEINIKIRQCDVNPTLKEIDWETEIGGMKYGAYITVQV